MDTPGSATKRSSRPKRKPFSDLTNTPSLNPKPKPRSVPEPEPEPEPVPVPVPVTETSDPQPVPSTSGDQENEWDQQGTPSKFKEVSPGFFCNADNNDEARISTVYTRVKARRKIKGKVLEAAPSLSCPPVGKNRSIEGSMRLKGNDADQSFSVPPDRAKKKKLYKEPVPVQRSILPGDFVEKQRAYFAEIDAFELPEEEVSDNDEEAVK